MYKTQFSKNINWQNVVVFTLTFTYYTDIAVCECVQYVATRWKNPAFHYQRTVPLLLCVSLCPAGFVTAVIQSKHWCPRKTEDWRDTWLNFTVQEFLHFRLFFYSTPSRNLRYFLLYLLPLTWIHICNTGKEVEHSLLSVEIHGTHSYCCGWNPLQKSAISAPAHGWYDSVCVR